jgi:hypothetical protein
VLSLITFPAMAVYVGLALVLTRQPAELVMIIPALLTLPVFAMIPCLRGDAVPFARAIETYKGAGRGFYVLGAMFAAMVIAGAAAAARHFGVLPYMLLGEAVLVSIVYAAMRRSVERSRWTSLE